MSYKSAVKILYFCFFGLSPFLVKAEVNYKFKPYGRIKATALYSNSFLNSFSFLNASAPTSAGTDEGSGLNNHSLTSFQVAQSRFGSDITLDDDIFGNLEFDFIDFAVSSPTTEAKPRLRRAFVGYKINSKMQIQIGQDWDTFSPLSPQLLDYVGLLFGAGNTGFMRQQVKWRHKNNLISSEISLGMAGKNPSPAYNAIELQSSPALAYNFSYNDFGFSTYYSQVDKNNTGMKDIYGLNIFAKKKLFPNLLVTAEAYQGQNMNDAALLGLSQITNDTSLQEYGGYINITYLNSQLGDFNINYGFSQISNPEDIGLYNFDTVTKRITENGIKLNQILRIYWNKRIRESLSFVAEVSYFKTERKISANDFKSDSAISTEAGLLLVF